MLAQDGLAECDQPGKNPLKYCAMAGNWTRATGKTDSEIHLFSNWAIMTRDTERQTVRYIHPHTELSWPGPQGGQTVSYPSELSWPGPQGGQTVRFIHFPTELSWPGPRGGQTVRFIHFPTELSWPRSWRGQTVRYIQSPTVLSWPRPWGGQTVRFIHFPTELSWLIYSHYHLINTLVVVLCEGTNLLDWAIISDWSG